MNRIKTVFWVLFVAVTLLFWLSTNEVERSLDAWALRKSLLYYFGVLSFVMMSAGVVLATRNRQIEDWLDGLDKHYRLHKWLGIGAAVFALLHWLAKKLPRWMNDWGWVDRGTFRTPKEFSAQFFHAGNPFSGLEDFAEDLGEWSLYLMLVLVVLALWKKFPYRYFFKTHKIIAIVYLALAFHSVVLIGKMGWTTPIAWLVALVTALGVVAAFLSLTQRIGYEHRAKGRIVSLVNHPQNRVLEVSIELTTPWEGHEEGQFAFVTFDRAEGPHPFTISSPWRHDGRVTFHIKALGDYTRELPKTAHVGNEVVVEGPYGKFQFNEAGPKQIWVAGGIGITPFLSRLQALAEQPVDTQRPIHLFYTLREADREFIDLLRNLTDRAQVHFHLVLTGRDMALNARRICETVPDYRDTQVWFCGPADFGRELKQDLVDAGLPAGKFHQELFNMR